MDPASARRQCGGMGLVDHRLAVGHQSDMDRARRCRALPQPEEHAAIGPEAHEVRVTRRTIIAIVVQALVDPQHGKHSFIEGDRAYGIADGQENMVEHGNSVQML